MVIEENRLEAPAIKEDRPSSASVDLAPFRALYPFRSQYFETRAGRIHYLDEGDASAPVLLMLHGNPTWSFYFRELVLAFRARYRVIAPDHLGCGLSDKPQTFDYTLDGHIANIEALVRHLGLDGITLVLHDWGGAIGMGFAVRHPGAVRRFVLFNTAAFPASGIPLSLSLCRVPGFGALAIRGFNAFARGALRTCVHHRERLTAEVRSGYLAPYDTWAHRIANLRFVQDIPTAPAHRGYGLLETIGRDLTRFREHPMLIIWGARDFVFTDRFLEEWRSRFPHAVVHRVEDAGHYVVEDAHERAVCWMRSFFGETDPREEAMA